MRWLRDARHPYRSMKEAFDGEEEYRTEPQGMSANEWIAWASDEEDYQSARSKYRFDPAEITGVKFLSILYELPYFKVCYHIHHSLRSCCLYVPKHWRYVI